MDLSWGVTQGSVLGPLLLTLWTTHWAHSRINIMWPTVSMLTTPKLLSLLIAPLQTHHWKFYPPPSLTFSLGWTKKGLIRQKLNSCCLAHQLNWISSNCKICGTGRFYCHAWKHLCPQLLCDILFFSISFTSHIITVCKISHYYIRDFYRIPKTIPIHLDYWNSLLFRITKYNKQKQKTPESI